MYCLLVFCRSDVGFSVLCHICVFLCYDYACLLVFVLLSSIVVLSVFSTLFCFTVSHFLMPVSLILFLSLYFPSFFDLGVGFHVNNIIKTDELVGVGDEVL